MHIREEENGFLFRLEVGDSLFDTLYDFAKKADIKAAFFWGLGAVMDITLGYYDLANKKYIENKFDGIWELVSLTGNLAQTDEGEIIHAHAVLSDIENKTIGGHVFSMTTAATIEIYLLPLHPYLTRKHDDVTGLKLLDI